MEPACASGFRGCGQYCSPSKIIWGTTRPTRARDLRTAVCPAIGAREPETTQIKSGRALHGRRSGGRVEAGRIRQNPQPRIASTAEFLSALGTFLAGFSSFAAVGMIILRHDPHIAWTTMIMGDGWLAWPCKSLLERWHAFAVETPSKHGPAACSNLPSQSTSALGFLKCDKRPRSGRTPALHGQIRRS
jgi:hypothetical protein